MTMLPEADRSAILQDLDYDFEALQDYYLALQINSSVYLWLFMLSRDDNNNYRNNENNENISKKITSEEINRVFTYSLIGMTVTREQKKQKKDKTVYSSP